MARDRAVRAAGAAGLAFALSRLAPQAMGPALAVKAALLALFGAYAAFEVRDMLFPRAEAAAA